MSRRRNVDPSRQALNDPLRSTGGLHVKGRVTRGVAEFLRLPLLITAGFCVLAVLVSALDGARGQLAPVRRLAETIVPEQGATDFVAAVAAGLLTVTAITFFVLSLAG